MAKEYSWEIRERAEELYIIDGLTYDQVATETDVSVSQLKRWGADSGWADRKKEYRQTLANIKRDRLSLRKKLLEKALISLNPQDIYASEKLEVNAAKSQVGKTEKQVEIDRPAVFLENLEWLAVKLKDLDPEGLKILARNFDALIVQFKAEHS